MLACAFGLAIVFIFLLFSVPIVACILQYWSQRSASTNTSEAAPVSMPLKYGYLGDEERDNFSHLWSSIQQRFGEDAEKAVLDADMLFSDLTQDYGADTDLEAQYAVAHMIAARVKSAKITTEELQHAMGLYGMIFGEILGHSVRAAPSEKRAA
jgi:uncharacterized SAM-binding protein YcdF (DUF218 family)